MAQAGADSSKRATCKVVVKGPYDIKQIWISKIQDKDDASKFMNLYITENNKGQIFYQSSDMYDTFGSIYDINQSTKDYLNNGYQAYYNWHFDTSKPRPAEYEGVYYGKQLLQNYLDDNPQIAVGSNEYYGLWIDCIEEYLVITEYSELVSQFFQTVAIIAGTVYQTVVTVKSVTMLAKQRIHIDPQMYAISKEAAEFTNSISHKLRTPKDTAYFWSGTTDGIGGKTRALEIANQRGGYTLEKLVTDNSISMPVWDENNPAVVAKWQSTSVRYAKNASGKVYAIIGKDVRPNSVWLNYELPTLKANPKVTQIIKIDPKTLQETIIFIR